MRNSIILIFLLLASFPAFSQSDSYINTSFPSVAGVSLGDSYKFVMSVLDNRFGEYNKSTTPSEETYYDVEVGGIYYKFAAFVFIHKNGKKILNQVRLYSNFNMNELNKAKAQRDYIAKVYRKKYSDMEERTDDNGF